MLTEASLLSNKTIKYPLMCLNKEEISKISSNVLIISNLITEHTKNFGVKPKHYESIMYKGSSVINFLHKHSKLIHLKGKQQLTSDSPIAVVTTASSFRHSDEVILIDSSYSILQHYENVYPILVTVAKGQRKSNVNFWEMIYK